MTASDRSRSTSRRSANQFSRCGGRDEEHLDEIKPILQEKLATLEEQKKRLVDAFVYKQAIDEETYKSELDRLRAEITVTRIEHNDSELDALDVETVLEFAEHVVLNARHMWNEVPLQHRRRMQKVLFPEGLIFEGEAFRTPVTCLFFRDLERSEHEEYEVVARTGFELRPGRRDRHPGVASVTSCQSPAGVRRATAISTCRRR